MTKRKSPRHYYVQKEGPSGRFYPIADSYGIESYTYGWFHALASINYPHPAYRLCEVIDGHCDGSDEHVVAEVGARSSESTTELTEFVRKSRDICIAATCGPWIKRPNDDPPKRPPLKIGVEMPPNFLCVSNAYFNADADFIAHARTALPRALHEIDCLLDSRDEGYIEGYRAGRKDERENPAD